MLRCLEAQRKAEEEAEEEGRRKAQEAEEEAGAEARRKAEAEGTSEELSGAKHAEHGQLRAAHQAAVEALRFEIEALRAKGGGGGKRDGSRADRSIASITRRMHSADTSRTCHSSALLAPPCGKSHGESPGALGKWHVSGGALSGERRRRRDS